MATLCIDGGKSQNPSGDILGAMTGDMGLNGEDIGKIVIHPMHAYVAVRRVSRSRRVNCFSRVKSKENLSEYDC